MCGIAGVLGRSDRTLITRLLDAQRQRGPDGRRVWAVEGLYTIGHDRLAIVDVAGGSQPIPNEDGSLWLAVNGEIYNHQALREQLESRHHFQTQSDSEVVLHLFEEEGPACVTRLDGMFAIALWGPNTGLFLARDPLGIKPLYYGRDAGGSLCFASEMSGLLAEATEVHALPPGSWWTPLQNPEPVHYFTVPEPTERWTHPQQTVNVLESTLQNAVRKRLMADVPLGVFLSGGLDSSLIAAMMRSQVACECELHSFSVGLEGSADLEHARAVAEYVGTVHHECILAPAEIYEALPTVINHLESCDPALVRSAVPAYFVSELASQFVKVVLSGEGADELFAGYEYLTEFDDTELNDELWTITDGLHNTNLQRVDRMTMAHGLEGRVPFLDRTVVDLAFATPLTLKCRDGEGKWILRKLAERYLPSDVVWRKKEKFAMGTGIGPLLEQYAEDQISEDQVAEEGQRSGRIFQAKEELLYWLVFRERYDRADVLSEMGRSRSLNPGQRWESAIS